MTSKFALVIANTEYQDASFESLVEGGMFHVDDHALHFLVCNQFREAVGFFLWGQRADGNIACSIGQHDQ